MKNAEPSCRKFSTEPQHYYVLEALPLLSQVVNDPLSKLPENIDATENAISAVTKICKYNHGNIPVDDIIPVWLSWLPILEDKEEAPHVYGYLCDLIQRYQFDI